MNHADIVAAVETVLGFLVMALVLVDVFVTVLYARARGGTIARAVTRSTWYAFHRISRLSPKRESQILALCGPAILILLVTSWSLALVAGSALTMRPALGSGIVASSANTPQDWIAAIYAAGSSLAIVGSGGFSPTTGTWRLLFLVNSLIGASVLSLTLTYMMQVYTALLRRNTLGLRLHLLTVESDDAAQLVARLGPQDDFQDASSTLAELASDMAQIKEAHHFYPVLFYFRFREPFYSVSQMALISLDAVALIKSALDTAHHAKLKSSATLELLSRSALRLLGLLHQAFLHDEGRPEAPDRATSEQWRRRYHSARYALSAAGISIFQDERVGFAAYEELRTQWHASIMTLAPSMHYDAAQVDPATVKSNYPNYRASL